MSAAISIKRSSGWVLAAVLAVAARSASASPEEAKQWLERMTEALATKNYVGLLTHSTPSQSESMRIVHRVEDGASLERLVSLDGSGREIIRTRHEVHAYLPDRRVVLVEPRSDDGSLLKALPSPGARLDAFYDLDVRKGNKLLGRDVQVVDIKSRDRYRYGYRLWLDEKTAMPLRSLVSDGNGRPVEQIPFTQPRAAEADSRQGRRAVRRRHGFPVDPHRPQARRAATAAGERRRLASAAPAARLPVGGEPTAGAAGFAGAGSAPDLLGRHGGHFDLHRAEFRLGLDPARIVEHGVRQRLLDEHPGPRRHGRGRGAGGHGA